jgi:hypothetical protein
MCVVTVFEKSLGIGKEIAVIEFHGERTVLQSDMSARVYNPGQPSGYAMRSGTLPEETIQEIYQEVCRNKVVGEVDGLEWHAEW